MGRRISEDTVVRDLVVKHPATRVILEKLGIDYCCGGKHTLKEAAVEKGMDLKKVLDGLNVVLTQTAARRADHRDWEAASLGELMDHILSRHHTFAKEQMPRLDALLAEVTKAHAANHGKMLRALQGVFGPFKAEIDGHLMKEERVLFPSIRRKEGKADILLDGPIRQMELEHENAGRALAAMRELTSGYRLPVRPSSPCLRASPCWRLICTSTSTLKTTSYSPVHWKPWETPARSVRDKNETLRGKLKK